MKSTVTSNNMVSIPASLSRKMGITPGCCLEWEEPEEGAKEIRVRVVPSRGDLAKKLYGLGAKWSPDRDSVAELIAERESEE